MYKKGFTLVELLAVIVILAIILAIAIPGISGLIKGATKGAFESDAKLVLNAIKLKTLEDTSLDPTTINETNITSLLKIGSSNYKKIKVTIEDGNLHIILIGQDKWKNLAVSGTGANLQLHDGLVLWYDFMNKTNSDTDKATATDLSGESHNGTLTNFTFDSTSGYNSGLIFDGVDDYISIGNIGFNSMPNSTVSFWRKASSNVKWLLLSHNSGSYLMATAGSTAFYHSSVGSGSVIYVDGVASNLPKYDNLWHHYLITNVNFSTWPTSYLTNYASWPYNNYLGDLKIYNKAFSASEAQYNYNVEKVDFGL